MPVDVKQSKNRFFFWGKYSMEKALKFALLILCFVDFVFYVPLNCYL